jgi:hypothetical protein
MLAVVLFGLALLPAAAQTSTNPARDWPTKPITMVVPFPAGSASDVVARILSPRLGELLKKQVIIENVAGTGGSNGALRVARAAPDGYQVVFGVTGTHSQNQLLYKKPPYDATTDFAPVGLIAEAPYMLITRPDYPAADLKEFIGYAKTNQSKLQYGSGGQGSGTHITCLLLNTALGIEVTHVPYRSNSQAMPDLLAGRIDYLCDPCIALPTSRKDRQGDGGAEPRARGLPAAPAHEQPWPTSMRRSGLRYPSEGHACHHHPKNAALGNTLTRRACVSGLRPTAAPCAEPAQSGLSLAVRGKRNQEICWTDQGERCDVEN